MSSPDNEKTDDEDFLGYLLKHAHLRFSALTDAALGPFGIDSKDLGALRVLATGEPRSQLQVAQILGVDRTTMVALLDALERKGLVTRQPDPGDRRRNVVELTEQGRRTYAESRAVYRETEDAFLAVLDESGVAQLRHALSTLIAT